MVEHPTSDQEVLSSNPTSGFVMLQKPPAVTLTILDYFSLCMGYRVYVAEVYNISFTSFHFILFYDMSNNDSIGQVSYFLTIH